MVWTDGGISSQKLLVKEMSPASVHSWSVGPNQRAIKSVTTTTTTTTTTTSTTQANITLKPPVTPPPTIIKGIKIDPKEKWIILHTYMRGGSTFLGAMFEKHPDAFYLFEPMFPIYQGMLGVPNTIHPLKIYATESATWRTPGQEEEQFVTNALLDMFTCNFQKLPLETLANTYMDFTKVYKYNYCTHPKGMLYNHCLKGITKNCPSHIETAFSNNCHLYLAKQHNDSTFSAYDKLNSSSFDKFPSFSNYSNCLSRMRQIIPRCLPRLAEPCKSSRLHVFKLIRGNADLLKNIMAVNPNTYILHLVRDPRGIVMSRKHTVTLSFDIQLEGKMLCEQIRRDWKDLSEIQKLYPERIKHLRYEDMAQDALAAAHDIYMFLGEEMHSDVTEYLTNATHSSKKAGAFNTERKNSTATAFAWRSHIKPALKQAMDSHCHDVLKFLRYDL